MHGTHPRGEKAKDGGELSGCRESPGACVHRFIHYTGLSVGGTAASKQRTRFRCREGGRILGERRNTDVEQGLLGVLRNHGYNSRVNLAECCAPPISSIRVDRAVYRNTGRVSRKRDGFRRFASECRDGGRAVPFRKIERGCHSAGIRLSAHVVRIYRKIDIGSETMVLPMRGILRELGSNILKYKLADPPRDAPSRDLLRTRGEFRA